MYPDRNSPNSLYRAWFWCDLFVYALLIGMLFLCLLLIFGKPFEEDRCAACPCSVSSCPSQSDQAAFVSPDFSQGKYLTVSEAADYLHTTPAGVHSLLVDDEHPLPYTKSENGTFYILKHDLDEYATVRGMR